MTNWLRLRLTVLADRSSFSIRSATVRGADRRRLDRPVVGPPTHPEAAYKNAVVVSTGAFDWDRPSTWTGAIDRSPCGTGTCARMASLYARGKLSLNEAFVHEGILGTTFTGGCLRNRRSAHTRRSSRRSRA